MEEELRSVAKNVYVTTDDGSYGAKGVVTDVLKKLVNEEGKKYTRCIAIGPVIMMKFAALTTKELGIPTIVSMNPIMIDGTGMCGACRLVVGDQVKFACVDGPEFDGHLVDFNLAMKRQQTYKAEEGKALLEAFGSRKVPWRMWKLQLREGNYGKYDEEGSCGRTGAEGTCKKL